MMFRLVLVLAILAAALITIRRHSIPASFVLAGFSLLLVAQYYAGLQRWVVYFEGFFLMYGVMVAWLSRPAWNRLWSPSVGIVLLIALIMIFGLVYTHAPGYGFNKIQRFLALAVMLTMSGQLVMDSDKGVRQLALTIAVISLATYVTHFIFIGGNVTRFMGITRYGELGSPIAIARSVGLGILTFIFLLADRRLRVGLPVWLAGIAAGVMIMVLTASRGPFLSLIAAMIAAYGLRTRKLLVGSLALVLVFAIGYVVLTEYAPPATYDRLIRRTVGGDDPTMSGRTQLWVHGLEQAAANPLLGKGTGGYAPAGFDAAFYPHNLFIELCVEHGVWGLAASILLVFFFTKYLIRCYRLRPVIGPAADWAISVAVFGMVNAQFSGDMPQQYALWFGLGMMVGLDRIYPHATIPEGVVESAQELYPDDSAMVPAGAAGTWRGV
ncbi:MAG TPA: O-antigen ligase family protein [Phycisphaerae bacterium]|nr:O-antigen ligase family protein [Phycisphaerae bacterium]